MDRLCEFIRHYPNGTAVFCDKPAVRMVESYGGFGSGLYPFCEEHASLLETERASESIEEP